MSQTQAPPQATGRKLARNSLYTMLGQGIPAVLALVAVPLLIRGIGNERYGFLSIGWVIAGYASLFDFGMGRALTKLVADRLGSGDRSGMGNLIGTALMTMGAVGTLGAALLAATTPLVFRYALKASPGFMHEAWAAWMLLALVVPVVILNSGVRGVLEAYQQFGVTNLVGVLIGIATFAVPIAMLPFTNSAVAMVLGLAVVRLFGLFAFAWYVLKLVPETRRRLRIDRSVLRELLSFGGWITVSNLITPIMGSADRFLVSGVKSLGVVAYYTTPYDFLNRLLLLPSSVSKVAFPAFATMVQQDKDRTRAIYMYSSAAVLAMLLPLCFLLSAYSMEWLTLWVGPDFAAKSAPVAKWIAFGILANGLASVPYALIQGLGKPHLTATLHLLELPLYVAALWFLTTRYGLVGTAAAWTARVTLDAALLFIVAWRVFPDLKLMPSASQMLGCATALALAAFSGLPLELHAKLAFTLAVMAAYAWFVWRLVRKRAQKRVFACE